MESLNFTVFREAPILVTRDSTDKQQWKLVRVDREFPAQTETINGLLLPNSHFSYKNLL